MLTWPAHWQSLTQQPPGRTSAGLHEARAGQAANVSGHMFFKGTTRHHHDATMGAVCQIHCRILLISDRLVVLIYILEALARALSKGAIIQCPQARLVSIESKVEAVEQPERAQTGSQIMEAFGTPALHDSPVSSFLEIKF